MKAYGKPRKACANRKIKGTSIDCPCCTPRGSNSDEATKAYKAKERSLKSNIDKIEHRTSKKLIQNALTVFLNRLISKKQCGWLLTRNVSIVKRC